MKDTFAVERELRRSALEKVGIVVPATLRGPRANAPGLADIITPQDVFEIHALAMCASILEQNGDPTGRSTKMWITAAAYGSATLWAEQGRLFDMVTPDVTEAIELFAAHDLDEDGEEETILPSDLN